MAQQAAPSASGDATRSSSSAASVTFPFPFPPYPIQQEFMRTLYDVLENKKIGIFESPTGTGKSLSIICGAMKWLRDKESIPLDPVAESNEILAAEPSTAGAPTASNAPPKPAKAAEDDEPDWIRDFEKKKKEQDQKRAAEEHARILNRQKRRLANLRAQERAAIIQMEPAAKRRKLNESDCGNRGAQQASSCATVCGSKNSGLSGGSGGCKSAGMCDSGGGGKIAPNPDENNMDDSQYLLLDYQSDADDVDAGLAGGLDASSSEDDECGVPKAKSKLRKNKKKINVFLGGDIKDDPDVVEEEEQNARVRKIFYCSRTHSQLSQFVDEVKRTAFGRDIRVINLSSRKNLCINPAVAKLPSANQINDRCLDMMQSKEKDSKQTRRRGHISLEEEDPAAAAAKSKCAYVNPDLQPLLRDNALAKPRDLEDLVKLGQSLNTCPYYGARSAVHSAELVVVPYQMILHKPTRESSEIDLRGNVVIFDEAHNIIDTVNAIHSIEISVAKLLQAHAQLSQYAQRYHDRLKPKNKTYIQQILFFIKSLLKFITPKGADATSEQKENSTSTTSMSNFDHQEEPQAVILSQNEFLFESGIDNINFFKLEKFFQKSEIVKKVNGFSQDFQGEIKMNKDHKLSFNVEAEEFEKHRPALGLVESFALSLTNRNADGRILVTRYGDSRSMRKSSLKFLLLNPETYFEEILTQARAVVLAGGTMQPFSDFTSHLVSPRINSERLQFLSCDHVIPDENLLGLVCDSGPSGVEFEFSYENRNNSKMIAELAQMVINICTVVPDGVVIFFPSYAYEEWVMEQWRISGALDRIGAKKRLFREPRHTSSVDDTLREYAKCIESNFPQQPLGSGSGSGSSGPRGAILSAVVGGKMSEGINFKDGLGRCVIMVGLPYPNARDPVLIEKMAYARHKSSSPADVTSSSGSGSEYYDNLCMKAVNQSIGRTIRHAGDYGAIVLVDKRFRRPQIQAKLPKWIRSRVKATSTFGEVFSSVVGFFKTKRAHQTEIEARRAEIHK